MVIKTIFFKEKYPEIYDAVINYKPPAKNINFFELVEKSLNNDILEKIGEYLNYLKIIKIMKSVIIEY